MEQCFSSMLLNNGTESPCLSSDGHRELKPAVCHTQLTDPATRRLHDELGFLLRSLWPMKVWHIYRNRHGVWSWQCREAYVAVRLDSLYLLPSNIGKQQSSRMGNVGCMSGSFAIGLRPRTSGQHDLAAVFIFVSTPIEDVRRLAPGPTSLLFHRAVHTSRREDIAKCTTSLHCGRDLWKDQTYAVLRGWV